LGNCLDLSKQSGIEEFQSTYNMLVAGMQAGYELPANKHAGLDDCEGILHNLDRAIVNYMHGRRISLGKAPYDCVRGLFHQGEPAVPTSAVGTLSHVQIAIRNTNCILGYFAPPAQLAEPFQDLNNLKEIGRAPYRKARGKK
jgi:hypothetical protein